MIFMEDAPSIKEEIRKKIRSLRDLQCDKVLLLKSGQIEGRLFSLPEFQKAKTVLFYMSMLGEVCTHSMIERALAMGKRVIVPRVRAEKQLDLCEIDDDSEFERSSFGILEPREGCGLVPLKEIDLAVVPGIAFDESGNRIGYSSGYYDRLLKSFRGLKIALAAELQVVEKVPALSHDVIVDRIITEKRMIDCKR